MQVEVLGKRHERSAFSCGVDALDHYLRRQASEDARQRVAAPFVLTQPPSTRVLGYYTLSASVIEVAELPADLARKLPRYPQLPVTLIGPLAVDHGHKGKGLGDFLLMDALWRSLAAAAQIAAVAVVVDAKDKAAEAFYRHLGFLPLQRRPARLLLPMTTVETLFA